MPRIIARFPPGRRFFAKYRTSPPGTIKYTGSRARQRLARCGPAIACALISDPTLLVCDEPTGDLDRATAGEILSLLQTLNRQQSKTIVMVTHDQKAADYASRILHVDKGQLVDAGAMTTA